MIITHRFANQKKEQPIVEKILLTPSNKVMKNRFVANKRDLAAPCSGVCVSGHCRATNGTFADR
jgi:hypothetical protein